MLNKYIDSKKDEILKEVCNIVKIPSVHEESLNEKIPFGESANKALEYFLDLSKRLGFKTKNVDGYCGYAEFGEGEELLGIIGHLDVVPVGEGWTTEPFNPKVIDGKLYGRGTIDDKGPVIAALYAMKAVKELCKINKRVRLIVGLNEERDWKCIEYYKLHEEMPTLGFSPDADFPCIYAEKGLISIAIKKKLENYKIIIKEIDCKNNAINVVPKYCSALLKFSRDIDIDKNLKQIEKFSNENNFEVKLDVKSDDTIKIEVFGKASHAAHPELGINAIQRLIKIVRNIYDYNNINDNIFSIIDDKFDLEINGKSLNLNVSDNMGELTLNVGRLYIQNDELVLESNLRIPVTYSLDRISNKFEKALEGSGFDIEYLLKKDSLYIPKDNDLVQKLCRVYNDYYGRNEDPIAIGGATYARAFKNCVSFGAMMSFEEDMCHKADEYIKLDYLFDACKIYAKAIEELTK